MLGAEMHAYERDLHLILTAFLGGGAVMFCHFCGPHTLVRMIEGRITPLVQKEFTARIKKQAATGARASRLQ
jgi:hypothetical protein